MTITAIPTPYAGVMFRSRLEATYAEWFDDLGWAWCYEPVAVYLEPPPLRVGYLCDFFLPHQNVWLEVKGPREIRLDKPARLARAFGVPAEEHAPLVVVLRPPERGEVVYHAATPEQDIILTYCEICCAYTWIDRWASWLCRTCWRWSRSLQNTAYVRVNQFDGRGWPVAG